ncbi:hypothetical protein [Amycolatopsis magusensis]|uniref:TrbL/VirB6 plasmid conjugal transfer protein n=1 Tax=Amycolatopsis magusensis TaxID=882444 RepID=A0ABS4PU09_9PSEU|nr:hypothetical protein [Amycolatopsis magusensis]MBP2182914.1 hypothetical protein [Amycolatopsis magusensis]
MVLVPLLAVAGITLTASATPAPTPHATAAAVPLAQPPVLPVPPVDDPTCPPGAVVPGCLPPVTPPPAPSPGPLPPVTEIPVPDPADCFPGSVLPGCPPPGGTEPPPACEGLNCIPQPVPPGAPAPGTPQAPGPGGEPESECGIFDPLACVTDGIEAFFRGVVTEALNPLLELLGTTLLTTPEPASLPAVGQLWTESWQLMLAVYATLIVIAGILLMGYETLQSRYTVKELAPRVVVGFLAGTLSQFVAVTGIRLANALSAAVMGDALDPAAAGKAMTDMVTGSLAGGGGWLFFIALALVAMIVVLLVTFIVRVMVTIAVIAAAPLALMCHALPHTEGIALTWWKGFGGLLAIQVGQSLTLVVALRVFFTPGGFTLFGPSVSGVVNLLLCLALMWILIKIPFWCLSPLRGNGRSLLGSLVRGAIAYKTMGLLGGAQSMLGGKGRKGGGRVRGSGAGGGVPDPPATRAGQFMLPMRVRRARPARRSPRLGELPGTGVGRRPGPGQMSLFTATGSGSQREVSANPRALPPEDLPGALPQDQLGLPIMTRRDPGRVGRRTVADDLADRPGMPPPVPQPGLLLPDGRINRNARPPAHLPRALIAPSTGMLPIHLRPAPPQPPRRTLADDLAHPAPTSPPPQPALITPSGHINRAARPPLRPIRDAYTGNRALASGQYPLPLGVRREPKPAAPPAAAKTASPPPKGRPGTQLRLPLDLPGRRGPTTK